MMMMHDGSDNLRGTAPAGSAVGLAMGMALALGLCVMLEAGVAWGFGPESGPRPQDVGLDADAGEGGQAKTDLAARMPDELALVGVDQKLDDMLPLDLEFRDEYGKLVRLGDYFNRGKPVVLNLGYYECPMLCSLMLNGLLVSVKDLSWLPGDEFEIVTVSIDPGEGSELALAKKKSYLAELTKGDDAKMSLASQGWHFLTGDQANIEQLSQAAGWRYQYNAKQDQYAHPSAIMIVTPDGRLSRYLFGVKFDSRTLRLSMVEAGEGKVGSLMDQFLLTCFQYDPESGSYTATAVGIMRLGGGLTVLVLGGGIGLALWREWRRREANVEAEGKNGGGGGDGGKPAVV